jgi:hypothetical protein
MPKFLLGAHGECLSEPQHIESTETEVLKFTIHFVCTSARQQAAKLPKTPSGRNLDSVQNDDFFSFCAGIFSLTESISALNQSLEFRPSKMTSRSDFILRKEVINTLFLMRFYK